MDPQSLSFVPSNDVWRLNNTMRSFQEIQQDHAERLMRLERRQDDDARMKSVWGSASPFPGVLSGTPQHGPVTQPSSVDFANFDDDQSNDMVRSLHLDADDGPRRFGVGSRTNSVRFDDSAKQVQWAHGARSSVDLPRSSSGLGGFGGHPMFERTVSHKSDGRQSSAGQSAVSGRANSLMLDSNNILGSSSSDLPTLAPGLFILGSVPAIIRCWLSTNFKHDSLLYAAICTGSYKSWLDARLVNNLGLSGEVRQDLSGDRKVRVPVYLPEAVPQPSSSRSSSPAPQLPSLTIDFTVVDRGQEGGTSKAVQIFLGSDVLRAHNADILFSSNSLTIFDDDRSKLSIPFVRPENEETFKTLVTSAASLVPSFRSNLFLDTKNDPTTFLNGESSKLRQETRGTSVSDASSEKELPNTSVAEITDDSVTATNDTVSEKDFQRKSSPVSAAPPKLDTKQPLEESLNSATSGRNGSSPAVWGSWRREGGNSQPEWANTPRTSSGSYQRNGRDQGIKVLKPTTRQPSRSATSTTPLPSSPTITGQSRFFDDGKRRTGSGVGFESSDHQQSTGKKSLSGEPLKASSQLRDGSTPTSSTMTPIGTKPRSSNPIGEASAFNWLNSGGQR